MSRSLTILALLAASLVGAWSQDAAETADAEEAAAAADESASRGGIRLGLMGVFVDDQDVARAFYTEKLGFKVKHDIPVGPYKWLTVTAPGGPDGTELLLEPNAHAAAATFQKAIKADGLPGAAFLVDDVEREVKRLREAGVEITTEPTDAGGAIIAVFDDTCGNLIQLMQEK